MSDALVPEQSPFIDFTREEWSGLRAATPLTLTEADLDALRGLNEPVEIREVEEVYLPLSRLLNLRFAAARELHASTETFLGQLHGRAPFVIAIAGSVAVGKSTIARILQALLGRWPDHPRVDLVPTDGFLYPNKVLEARGLMARKGFPESYDVRNLIRFLVQLKSGDEEVHAPKYSHLTYDIVEDDELIVRRPDICVIEGLNLLQTPTVRAGQEPTLVVSDFFDFTVYIDANERDIEAWYGERFLALRDSAFQDTRSFFHHFTQYSEDDARAIAASVWHDINGVNLRENIEPTKGRADVILEKGRDHAVRRVRLRKL